MAVAVMGACASPPPDNTPDPCAILSTECPHCTQPGPKGTCENALATSDDVQCTVALDDTSVIADCVVPDGGGDAAPEASTDAPALPICDAAQVSADAGCSCVGLCLVTCPGGGCTIACPAAATCQASCSGGGCIFQCAAGATCTDSCTGGGCSFQCANDSVCNDTCALTPPCAGP
jgi:hypothetical protein